MDYFRIADHPGAIQSTHLLAYAGVRHERSVTQFTRGDFAPQFVGEVFEEDDVVLRLLRSRLEYGDVSAIRGEKTVDTENVLTLDTHLSPCCTPSTSM